MFRFFKFFNSTFYTAPDPEYYFLKILPFQQTGYLGRNARLSCFCSEDAQTSWFKNDQEINEDDERYVTSSSEGEHVLEVLNPELEDIGKYSCRITKFGKEGECETSCFLNIIGPINYFYFYECTYSSFQI